MKDSDENFIGILKVIVIPIIQTGKLHFNYGEITADG